MEKASLSSPSSFSSSVKNETTTSQLPCSSRTLKDHLDIKPIITNGDEEDLNLEVPGSLNNSSRIVNICIIIYLLSFV